MQIDFFFFLIVIKFSADASWSRESLSASQSGINWCHFLVPGIFYLVFIFRFIFCGPFNFLVFVRNCLNFGFFRDFRFGFFIGWLDDSVFVRRSEVKEDWARTQADPYSHKSFTTDRRKVVAAPGVVPPGHHHHHPQHARKVSSFFSIFNLRCRGRTIVSPTGWALARPDVSATTVPQVRYVVDSHERVPAPPG